MAFFTSPCHAPHYTRLRVHVCTSSVLVIPDVMWSALLLVCKKNKHEGSKLPILLAIEECTNGCPKLKKRFRFLQSFTIRYTVRDRCDRLILPEIYILYSYITMAHTDRMLHARSYQNVKSELCIIPTELYYIAGGSARGKNMADLTH